MFPVTGLAFSGGRGRGAYQIGVWTERSESGLITYTAALSGTSVDTLTTTLLDIG